ncbi:hypothetical protein HK405_009977 [Cladochytrium tenue]|nr:hypothetical protein HK405_009977 [Cladochytrium tenue]
MDATYRSRPAPPAAPRPGAVDSQSHPISIKQRLRSAAKVAAAAASSAAAASAASTSAPRRASARAGMMVDPGGSSDDDSDGGSAASMQVDLPAISAASPPSRNVAGSSIIKDTTTYAAVARAETGRPSVDTATSTPTIISNTDVSAVTATTVRNVTARVAPPNAARPSASLGCLAVTTTADNTATTEAAAELRPVPTALGSATDSVGFNSASSFIAKSKPRALKATAKPTLTELDAAGGAATHDTSDVSAVGAAAATPRQRPEFDPLFEPSEKVQTLAHHLRLVSAWRTWKLEPKGLQTLLVSARELSVSLRRAAAPVDANWGICAIGLDPEAFAAALKTKTAVKGLEPPPDDDEDPVVYVLKNTVLFAAFPRGLSEAANSSMETFRRLFLVSTVDRLSPKSTVVRLKPFSRKASKKPERSGELILGTGWTRIQKTKSSTSFLTESSVQKSAAKFQLVNDKFTQVLQGAFRAQTKALDDLESETSQRMAYLSAMITSTSVAFEFVLRCENSVLLTASVTTMKLHKDPDFSGYITHHNQPVAVLPWGCLNAVMKIGAPSLVTFPVLGFERRLGNGAMYFSRAAFLQHSAEAPGDGEGNHISCISYTSHRDVAWRSLLAK